MDVFCPNCGHPARYVGSAEREDGSPGFEEVYECPNEDCPVDRFRD